MTRSLLEEEITAPILAAAIEVHRVLGPGLLESAYQKALCLELSSRGLAFEKELDLPLHYKGVELGEPYRIDVLVEDRVILEIKSVDHILVIHEAQLLTYLRLSRKHVGFLLNFNVPLMKKGILRRVL